MRLLTIAILLFPIILQAQTQDEFNETYMSVYMNMQDTVKAQKMAMELYDSVENTEELQTIGNYYVLRAIFTTLKNEELAAECEKKAQAQIDFSQKIEKPTSYANPAMEWAYEYQLEFYKSSDPALGKKALKFLEEHPNLINFTNYAAVAYFYERLMDFDKAASYYALAFEHIDKNNEYVSLIQPAFFYMKIGQYEKVDECLELNKELLKEADQYTKVGYESAQEMIQMYYYLYIGDYYNYIQLAGEFYKHQYELNKANLVGDPYASIGKMNKALGYEYLRQYDKAAQYYRESQEASEEYLNAMKKKYPKYRQENFPILNMYLAKRGDLSNLEEKIKELDHYYNYIEEHTQPTLAQEVQKAMQYALYKDNRYPELYKDVINKLSKVRDYNEATGPYAHYAYFMMRDGDDSGAEKIYDQLFDENLDYINDLIFTFGEKAFVAYFTTKLREGYQNYHSFVKHTYDNNEPLHRKLAGNAYNNLLLTKSIAFKGIRKRKQAFTKSNNPEVIELYNEWLTKKQQLIRMYQMAQQDNQDLATTLNVQQSAPAPVSKEKLDSLQKEVDQLENRLATSAQDFEETLEITKPKWQSVRALLKSDEAAIELVRFHWRNQIYYSDTAYYAAYIVRHDSNYPEVVYLSSGAGDLDTKYYNLYKNSIQLKINDNTSYEQYWKPIKDKLNGIKKVYLSPDGIYHLINVSTLRNPETGDFLLDEMEVINVTSTADVGSGTPDTALGSAVLVGRPQYAENTNDISLETLQTRSFKKDFRNASIADLPGTEDEVNSIAEKLENEGVQVKELLGKDATEGEMYALEAPDVLHIATHGFWSGTENATPGYRMLNAMMNSGLLMAGVVDYYSADVQKESNDGILTAYEAQNLNLEGTKLVVLSACETGLGDFDAGEGVYGLQRAFRTAGAQSIITTLWKVDDQGTRDFMIYFYQQLVRLGNRQAAFRAASLAMKEKYRDPYYWGAFVLTGR